MFFVSVISSGFVCGLRGRKQLEVGKPFLPEGTLQDKLYLRACTTFVFAIGLLLAYAVLNLGAQSFTALTLFSVPPMHYEYSLAKQRGQSPCDALFIYFCVCVCV